METIMRKEYELLYISIDYRASEVFISDKVKRNKLAKRLPELKGDINSAIQLNEDEKRVFTCEECVYIAVHKGKSEFEKRIRGKHSIQVYHDAITLIKL